MADDPDPAFRRLFQPLLQIDPLGNPGFAEAGGVNLGDLHSFFNALLQNLKDHAGRHDEDGIIDFSLHGRKGRVAFLSPDLGIFRVHQKQAVSDFRAHLGKGGQILGRCAHDRHGPGVEDIIKERVILPHPTSSVLLPSCSFLA
jgi:hypothetical protein